NEQGALPHDFEPPGDAGMGDAVDDRGVFNPVAARTQGVGHSDGGHGVVDLVTAEQRAAEFANATRVFNPERLSEHVPFEHFRPVPVGNVDELRADFLASFADNVDDFGVVLGSEDADAAGLDDAGLVAGDLGGGVAENGRVFERNRGDNRGVDLLEHVGGVERAAEPDFDHLPFDPRNLGPGEPEEERGEDAEGADVPVDRCLFVLDVRANRFEGGGELGGGHRFTVDRDAFGE